VPITSWLWKQMNGKEWIDDFQREQIWKEMERLWNKYYKTPWFIKQEILSIMSDSDIAIIVWDKRKEWGELESEKKSKLKWLRWDNRKILELIYLDKQEKVNKIIRELQYILKSRQGWNQWWFNPEDLERAKESISISEVIQIVAWIKIKNINKLINCPLHEDNTASFKIYHKTNSFYCQWCKVWWSSIDFIKNYYNISIGEAIKKFLTLYKK